MPYILADPPPFPLYHPSLSTLPSTFTSLLLFFQLQCVPEGDLADVFDELTGNLHVCAKNGGEKGREVEGGREGGREE